MAELKNLYERLKTLNVVDNQKEFSALWGKGESWYSTSVARRRPPGLDALVRFHLTLRDLERESRDAAATETDQQTAACYLAGADETAEINAAIWTEIERIASRNEVADRP